MKKRTAISAAIGLVIAACASAPQGGAPAQVMLHKSVAEAQNAILAGCTAGGSAIVGQTANTVTCEGEISGGKAGLFRLMNGGASSTQPIRVLRFVCISQGDSETLVTWSASIKNQSAFGQVHDMPYSNGAENQRIAAVLRRQ